MTNDYDTPKRRRWLRWLLAASLALNLLVIGLAAGAVLRHGGMRDAHAGKRPPPSLGAVMYRALPRDDRHALREAAATRDDSTRPEAGDRVARLTALIRAEAFDADAVAALLAEENARRDAWLARAEAGLLTRISDMDDAARSHYAERIEDLAARKRKGGARGAADDR
jgi:uncharacterized membrane protein